MQSEKLKLRSENDIVNRFGLSDRRSLRQLVSHPEKYYQKKAIVTGKNGKERTIYVASGCLRRFLQKCNAQLRSLPKPPECIGGVTGYSVKHNAERHKNQRFVMNLDLANFFPTVTPSHVSQALQRHGCMPQMSEIIAGIVTRDNHLPQGFHTSPLLSIQVLVPLVEELRRLLTPLGFTFTFWIDDLTISGRESPEYLIPQIAALCEKQGFSLNTEKYHCGEKGVSTQEVTGVVINGNELRPAGGFIRRTEKMIYVLSQYGISDFNATFDTSFASMAKLLAHVEGRLTWIHEFTPEKAEQLRIQLNGHLVKDALRTSVTRVFSATPALATS